MKAELISVGTELLLGHTIDTDAAYASRELAAAGVESDAPSPRLLPDYARKF